MKVSEIVSTLFSDMGDCWLARINGKQEHLIDVCKALSAKEEWEFGANMGGGHRFTFQDGSIITIHGDAWDFGFDTCWCWEGSPDPECKQEH
jgi:hypothetical protein